MERDEIFEEIDASKEREYIAGDEDNVSANYVCLMEEKRFEGALNYIFENTICGRSLAEWVGKACPDKPIFLTLSNQENFLDLIRPYTKVNDYTVVIYASTPLITRGFILDMLGFAARKRLNVCRLKCGYILKNEYIANIDEIFSKIVYNINSNDMLEIVSPEDLDHARKILVERVFSFHKRNGVIFENERMTNLDANVYIESGAQIFGGVSLSSGSFIGEGVVVQEDSIITNSKVLDNSIIETGAIVKNSIVKAGSVVETASVVNHSIVGEKSRICLGAKLSGSAVSEGVVVGENSVLDNVNVLEFAKIGKNSVIVGDGVPVEIHKNAVIEPCTKIVKKIEDEVE